MNEIFRKKLASEIKQCPDESAMNEIVSQNIKDIMETYDLKAWDLASICGLSASGVYRWINAKNTPKFVVLYPLCRALDVPISCFAEPKGVMNYLVTHKDKKELVISGLTTEEQRLILKYNRLSPEIKKAIDTLIDNCD